MALLLTGLAVVEEIVYHKSIIKGVLIAVAPLADSVPQISIEFKAFTKTAEVEENIGLGTVVYVMGSCSSDASNPAEFIVETMHAIKYPDANSTQESRLPLLHTCMPSLPLTFISTIALEEDASISERGGVELKGATEQYRPDKKMQISCRVTVNLSKDRAGSEKKIKLFSRNKLLTVTGQLVDIREGNFHVEGYSVSFAAREKLLGTKRKDTDRKVGTAKIILGTKPRTVTSRMNEVGSRNNQRGSPDWDSEATIDEEEGEITGAANAVLPTPGKRRQGDA